LDGDWAWFDVPTTDDGIEFHDREVAADDDSWYINAFSFHPELGFAMLDEVVVVRTFDCFLDKEISISFWYVSNSTMDRRRFMF
jgi:hypothetical protein